MESYRKIGSMCDIFKTSYLAYVADLNCMQGVSQGQKPLYIHANTSFIAQNVY